jgi:excisionase family DNA binding protein
MHGSRDAANTDEALLTARQVAMRLGVSCETVLRWTRAGKIQGFRMPGGALRYEPRALHAWLADHATSNVEADTGAAAVAAPTVTPKSKRRQRRGGRADAADSARTGVQAPLW